MSETDSVVKYDEKKSILGASATSLSNSPTKSCRFVKIEANKLIYVFFAMELSLSRSISEVFKNSSLLFISKILISEQCK